MPKITGKEEKGKKIPAPYRTQKRAEEKKTTDILTTAGTIADVGPHKK